MLKLLRFALLLVIVIGLDGCVKITKRQQPKNPIAQKTIIRHAPDQAWLMQVQPDNLTEKLVLTPATYRNGVYVCAIENLSKPCLPKLSAIVADKLEQKGIVVVTDQDKAVATLYFETWFDSFSRYANVEKTDHGVWNNPAIMGKDFASRIEKSLETGMPPDVHKKFRDSSDPFASVTVNSNDDQKFIYVAFTAIDMDDAIDYPGEGDNHVGASSNPWVNPEPTKKRWSRRKSGPPTRTLIGSYTGEIQTEKAVMPMLNDAIDLLIARVSQSPKRR